MITQKQRTIAIFVTPLLILLLPLLAMRFTNEVNWSLFDFLVMGFLLFSVAFTVEIAFRMEKRTKYRIIYAVGILIVLFLIWAELAVGIFGSPFAGN